MKNKIIVKKTSNGNEIFYGGQYVATYVHNLTDSFIFTLENAHKTDLDKLEDMLEEKIKNDSDTIENCSSVHKQMTSIFDYKFCPICGSNLLL